jgi:hypothetical protein
MCVFGWGAGSGGGRYGTIGTYGPHLIWLILTIALWWCWWVSGIGWYGTPYCSLVVQDVEEEDAEGSPWALQDHSPLVAAGRSLGRV